MAAMPDANPQSQPNVRAALDAPPAHAWDPTRETMVAGYLGVPYTYNSDVRIKSPPATDVTVKDVAWQGKPFTNPIYYGVRVVRWGAGGRTGAMLDFTHSKAISDPKQEALFEGTIDGHPAPERALIKDMFGKLEASHGHNMLTLNGLWRMPSLSSRLFPYIGFGAGISLPHSEVHLRAHPSRTYEYQFAGPVAQGLIGLEIRLQGMSYFVEYKFSFADYAMPLTHRDGYVLFSDLWLQFKRWWSGEAPPGGWATTTYTSHQVIGGLGKRFAAGAEAR